MTDTEERRYRRLLALYPRDHRERHGEEMLGVLLAAGGGWRDTVDLVAGAIALHLRRIFGLDGGVRRADAMAVVSLLGPIMLVAGAAPNLHEIAWWIRVGSFAQMPLTQVPDAPAWAAWLVVAALALFGRRRAAAVAAWLAVFVYLTVSLTVTDAFLMRFENGGWLLLGLFTAIALTWSPGPVAGRALVGRRGVVLAVAGVVAMTVVTAFASRLYRLSPMIWEYGPLIEVCVLAIGGWLACRAVASRRTGRRAVFVLALPAFVVALDYLLGSIVGPPLYWVAAVDFLVFYGFPTLLVLAGNGILRPIGTRQPS